MYERPQRAHVLGIDAGSGRVNRVRIAIFLIVFLFVAGGGIAFDYSRPALYRASARVSVEPPGVDDAAVKAQFAVSEAVALRRAEIMAAVAQQMGIKADGIGAEALARQLSAEAVPQTGIVELWAEGGDRSQLVAALTAWIEAYRTSRKQVDQREEADSLAEAKHALEMADKAIQAKRLEIDSFRQRHGITSIERDENPGAARLKGLHVSLSDAAAKEVAAEAKLRAIDDSLAQGKGYVRAADRTSIGGLEMRAVELREKMKDFEHDFTPQYLALEPKYKALKTNLERLERQIDAEKQRSLSTARAEAQEEFAAAQRASQRLRSQIEDVKQDTQTFSMRFVELRRMTLDFEQLQEARQTAVARMRELDSARQPAQVRIQVMAPPVAELEPIAPDYTRDAGIALGAGFILAITAVWLGDYLRREPQSKELPTQPIIQVAYPMLDRGPGLRPAAKLPAAESIPELAPPSASRPAELNVRDVSALWKAADESGRLILSLLFTGLQPAELRSIRWRDVNLQDGSIDVSGSSARKLRMVEPLPAALSSIRHGGSEDGPLVADGAGQALSESDIDAQLVFLAHDAGLHQPETVTSRALHYTYAAYLARQGIRMSDLSAVVGRLSGEWAAELIRLSPPAGAADNSSVQRVYPSFRAA